MNLTSTLENFTLSWDVGIVVFLFFAAFFYGFSVGARKLVTLLVSIYFTDVLMNIAPYLVGFLDPMPDYRRLIFKWAIFAILAFSLSFLLAGSIMRSSLALPKVEDGRWWHLILLSIVTAGFFAASAVAMLPEIYYDKLSPFTKSAFLLNNSHFGWAVAGIAVLIVLRKTKKQ